MVSEERRERMRRASDEYLAGKICLIEMNRRGWNPNPHSYTAEVLPECRSCHNLEDCKERYGWIWIRTPKEDGSEQ